MEWVTTRDQILSSLVMGYDHEWESTITAKHYELMRSVITDYHPLLRWRSGDTFTLSDSRGRYSLYDSGYYTAIAVHKDIDEPFGIIMNVIDGEAFVTVVRQAKFINSHQLAQRHIFPKCDGDAELDNKLRSLIVDISEIPEVRR